MLDTFLAMSYHEVSEAFVTHFWSIVTAQQQPQPQQQNNHNCRWVETK